MFVTFLEKLNGLLDRRFIIVYWVPIFIGCGLIAGEIGVLSGYATSIQWWDHRSATEQIILGIGALFVISVLAYLLEMFTTSLVRFYEGYWPENVVTSWTFKLQRRRKAKGGDTLRYHDFPRASTLVKPTRLGNILTAAEEHAYQLYRIDAVLWWPRLVTLLPETFRIQVDAELMPMLAMLNLSLVFSLLAVGSGILTISMRTSWWITAGIILGGLLLARLCYMAATQQAVNYGAMVRVAFDLYRYDILKQMHVPFPDNLFAERLLWDLLNRWIYSSVPPWEIRSTEPQPPLPDHPFYNDTHSTSPPSESK